MLCFQDCVDMCDLSPDEERAIRDRLTLAEIGEALAIRSQASEPVAEPDCITFHPVRIEATPLQVTAGNFTYRSPSAMVFGRHC